MINNKYELELVSMEQGHNNKTLKKYSLGNGFDTVGVYENEPFMIRFRNKTHNKIQVKISVDGTDILSGEPATTNLDGSKSWVVNGYDTLELKAWPEDNGGGAEFIFGQVKNSVAANTHGDMSGRGIIAVAVFEESYAPKIYPYTINRSGPEIYWNSCSDNCTLSDISEPAVGAGDYVEQKIGTASGLIQPKLETVVQLKYDWWGNLRTNIRKFAKEQEVKYAGFPGDKVNIDLSNVPRLETTSSDKNRIRRKRFAKKQPAEQKYVEHSRFV